MRLSVRAWYEARSAARRNPSFCWQSKRGYSSTLVSVARLPMSRQACRPARSRQFLFEILHNSHSRTLTKRDLFQLSSAHQAIHCSSRVHGLLIIMRMMVVVRWRAEVLSVSVSCLTTAIVLGAVASAFSSRGSGSTYTTYTYRNPRQDRVGSRPLVWMHATSSSSSLSSSSRPIAGAIDTEFDSWLKRSSQNNQAKNKKACWVDPSIQHATFGDGSLRGLAWQPQQQQQQQQEEGSFANV